MINGAYLLWINTNATQIEDKVQLKWDWISLFSRQYKFSKNSISLYLSLSSMTAKGL